MANEHSADLPGIELLQPLADPRGAARGGRRRRRRRRILDRRPRSGRPFLRPPYAHCSPSWSSDRFLVSKPRALSASRRRVFSSCTSPRTSRRSSSRMWSSTLPSRWSISPGCRSSGSALSRGPLTGVGCSSRTAISSSPNRLRCSCPRNDHPYRGQHEPHRRLAVRAVCQVNKSRDTGRSRGSAPRGSGVSDLTRRGAHYDIFGHRGGAGRDQCDRWRIRVRKIAHGAGNRRHTAARHNCHGRYHDRRHPLMGLSGSELRKIRGFRLSMRMQDPFTMLNPLMRSGDTSTRCCAPGPNSSHGPQERRR